MPMIRVKKLVVQPESTQRVANYEVTAEAIEGKKKTPIRVEVQFEKGSTNKFRLVYVYVDTTQPVTVDEDWLPSLEEASIPKIQELVSRIWERFTVGK